MIKTSIFLFLFYIFVGFFVIPYSIYTFTPTILKSTINSDAHIGYLFFNPFTFELEVNDFLIEDKNSDTLLFVNKFYVDIEPSKLINNMVLVKTLKLDGTRINITKNQKTNFQYIIDYLDINKGKESKKDNNSTLLFDIVLDNFTFSNGIFSFKDSSKREKFDIVTKPIDFSISNVNFKPNYINKINLDIATNKTGSFKLNTNLKVEPFLVDGNITLSEIDLSKILKYTKPKVSKFIDMLPIDLTCKYIYKEKTLEVEELNITTKKISIHNHNFNFNIHHFNNNIKNIALILDKNISYNVNNINTNIKKINIYDINRSVSTKFTNFENKVDIISSDKQVPTSLSVKSIMDNYGSILLKADLFLPLPFEETIFKVNMTNIDLALLSPYSENFLGRETINGKLDIFLDYDIYNSKLHSRNKVIVKNIKLGKKVESKDAIKAPVTLAIGLLKDINNNIVIDIPIKGDINNPDFHIAKVVRKTVTNMILNVASSPFTLLSSMVGFNGDDMSEIIFNDGKSEIVLSQKEKLDKIIEVLNKKQTLVLKIKPSYSHSKDYKAIKKVNPKLSDKLVTIKLQKLALSRAKHIRNYLLKNGLNSNRVKIVDDVVKDSNFIKFEIELK